VTDDTGMSGVDAPLDLALSPLPGTRPTPTALPLRLAFANTSGATVRILDCFEPPQVFFSVRIVRCDGTPVIAGGAGKIDFGPGEPSYVELAPGQTHAVDLDAARMTAEPVAAGHYAISVTYHNQYGRDCFRGTLDSNEIDVEVSA
jgi:hypothetical protein